MANPLIKSLYTQKVINELNKYVGYIHDFNFCDDFNPIFRIRNDEYRLRSIVVSEINDIGNDRDIVIGSSTLCMIHQDYAEGIYQNEYFIYDPYSVVKPSIVNGVLQQYRPIDIISGMDNGEGFIEIGRKRGIVFMYQLVKDSTEGIITF